MADVVQLSCKMTRKVEQKKIFCKHVVLTLVLFSIPPMAPLIFESEHPILYGRRETKRQVNCDNFY